MENCGRFVNCKIRNSYQQRGREVVRAIEGIISTELHAVSIINNNNKLHFYSVYITSCSRRYTILQLHKMY